MSAPSAHLQIGSLLFADLDQLDLTGPFEVLARIPGATARIYGVSPDPVRDSVGLVLTPDATIDDAPQLDVVHIPGGPGQQALMEDERVLAWLRHQTVGAQAVLSVCTGALLLGGAGLLAGRRATTYWASYHLLESFGATPVDARVVVDGSWVFAAGVTAGIDGALTLVARAARPTGGRDHPARDRLRARAALRCRYPGDGAGRDRRGDPRTVGAPQRAAGRERSSARHRPGGPVSFAQRPR